MIRRFLSRAIKADTGNLSIMFALALLPLIASAGFAIDLLGAGSEKAKTDAAADAGVLAAVRAASEALIAGDGNWKNRGEAAGRQAFLMNIDGGSRQRVGKLDVKITRTGNSFNGTLGYEYAYETAFMRIFNRNEMTLADNVSANVSMPNYIDIRLLVDVSPSMGIGSTLTDQQTLQTAIGCALACHYTTPGATDNFAGARATGAKLRIDVVREAVEEFIEDLQDKRASTEQVRLSIDLFSNQIIPLFAQSTDLDAALAAAAAIDLVNLPYNEGTNIAYSLSQLAAAAPVGGDGSSQSQRKSYVVLLSDGVENSHYGIPSGSVGVISAEIKDPNFIDTTPSHVFNAFETIQTIDRNACDAVKTRSHTMMMAHIEYLIPPPWSAGSVPRFNYIASTITPKSLDEFLACASAPEYSYTASSTAEIGVMFDDILEDVLAPTTLRLTD